MDYQMQKFIRNLTGRPQDDRPIFIISGAPGSGKTAYVRDNKQAGDLVFDMDAIAAALQGETIAHPTYDHVMDAALAAREAVYQSLEQRRGNWKRAFVITASPDAARVSKLAKRLDGSIVTMPTTRDECVNRIKADKTRANPEGDIQLANQWFDKREK